jgi:hypothetical protein
MFVKRAVKAGNTWELWTVYGNFIGNPVALEELGNYFIALARKGGRCG